MPLPSSQNKTQVPPSPLIQAIQQVLKKEHFSSLKTQCTVMLKQWSKKVLEQWIEVYSALLSKMKQLADQDPAKLERECLETVLKMSDLSQPIQVRMSSSKFITSLATNLTLQTSTTYVTKIIPKVKQLCQDFNWELREEMCRHMFKISCYIGEQASVKHLFPELLELLEDEETQVKKVAINNFAKHLGKLYSDDFCQSPEVLTAFKKIIQTANSQQTSRAMKDLILSKLDVMIKRVNNSVDMELMTMTQDLLLTSLGTEFGRERAAYCLSSVAEVYSKNNKVLSQFYQPIYRQMIKEELSSANIGTLKGIARSMSDLVVKTMGRSEQSLEIDLQLKGEILGFYSQLLKQTNKDILNELALNGQRLFEYFYQTLEVIDKSLQKEFKDKIKKLYFGQIERHLQGNWRYHLNYFQFIDKLFGVITREEAGNELIAIMIKGLRSPSISLPVKRYIAERMANAIATIPNFKMRFTIQEVMLKEFVVSESSQQRQIYLYFVEHLLPQISKQYFKQTFMDAYFFFKDDNVLSLLMHFIRLAPLVRMKLDEVKAIDKLQQAIKFIFTKHTNNKKAVDLIEKVQEIMVTLKDPVFLADVKAYQAVEDKKFLQNEQQLSGLEKDEKESAKKKELEGIVKQAREDYMKKMNSANGLNAGQSSTIKDPKNATKGDKRGQVPSIGLSSKLATKKMTDSSGRPKEEQKTSPIKKTSGISSSSSTNSSKGTTGAFARKK